MAHDINARINRQLDRLDDPQITETELETVERKLRILKELKGEA